MGKAQVLIVDDEPDIRELLDLTLSRMKLVAHLAGNLAEAHKLLAEHPYDLCLTDMRLPDGEGTDLVDFINTNYPETPVAVITAFGSMQTAVEAMKKGAFDFVSKPIDLDTVRNLVNSALKLHEARHEGKTLSDSELVGESSAIRETRALILKLARSQAPVLITGGTGTGKELVARLIHEQGQHREGPFVAINCGAIPAELMESEFFGYKKGSFTGANIDKDGLFQTSQNGTLFLDEIADLPLNMQVKLLRALQERKIRPLGMAQEISIDVRIISATNKNLDELLDQGKFRQDLYFRINVIEMKLPPLRERIQDIPLLVESWMNTYAAKNNAAPHISESALEKLMRYDFPGNIRELENILERTVALCDGLQISDKDIHLSVANDTGANSVYMHASEPENLPDDFEKERLISALEESRWNRTQAAKKLGMTLRQLRYRLKKFGLQ